MKKELGRIKKDKLFTLERNEYRVIYSKRKSYSLEVLPCKNVILRVPEEAQSRVIESFIRKKLHWIKKQKNYFDSFGVIPTERKYISGESHFFLGDKYRLKVIESTKNAVELVGNRDRFLKLYTKNTDANYLGRKLETWKREKLHSIVNELLEECFQNFSKKTGCQTKSIFRIKRMRKSWGRMNKNGVMTLNLKLAEAPIECIKYVINHELCHLIHFNHSREFYALQESITPDWKALKWSLETFSSK